MCPSNFAPVSAATCCRICARLELDASISRPRLSQTTLAGLGGWLAGQTKPGETAGCAVIAAEEDSRCVEVELAEASTCCDGANLAAALGCCDGAAITTSAKA